MKMYVIKIQTPQLIEATKIFTNVKLKLSQQVSDTASSCYFSNISASLKLNLKKSMLLFRALAGSIPEKQRAKILRYCPFKKKIF